MNLSISHIALAAALLLGSTSTFAASNDDAKALISNGLVGEALTKLDQHLAKNPQDASARFSRGLALIKLNRTSEAIKAFADLTRDFPQLPEPYNNLAVIYAQQGDYDKARDALEAALATHPSYATAHENLGDIYAALAGAAYNRALLLDQSNQTVRNKLNLISQLDRSLVVPKAPVIVAKPLVIEKPPVEKPQTVAKAPVAEPVVAAPPTEPVAVAAPPAAKEPAVASSDTDGVSKTVVAWANAWSSKDLLGYFDTYADDFTPEGDLSRTAWEQQRKERISKPSRIQVEARNVKFTRTGENQMRVNFTQQYESDTFSDSVAKVLDMKFSNGVWKIVREYTR